MNSESVDLIATDPPFNKGRDFHATPDSLAAGAKFQDRWSWERDVHQDWVDQITDDYPRLMEAIESARYAHSDGMGAYMCFMAVRLLAMRRVLKPTGSIYVHCDPTASHYLKAVMDAVFGWKQFRNDIVWKRTSSHNSAKRWGPVHDTILFYGGGVWNRVLQPLDKDYVERHYRHEDPRGRFQVDNLTGSGTRTGDSGKPWRNIDPTAKGRHWAVPDRGLPDWIILPVGYSEMSPQARLDVLDAQGLIYWPRRGTVPRFKRYLTSQSGAAVSDVIVDIPPLATTSKEKTGFATQKPISLYERIIRASSNEGDVVLDPFAGCATTLVAAESLDRQWVGIDIWDGAHKIVVDRLRDTAGLFGDVIYTDKPPDRTDDGETASPFLRVTPKRAARYRASGCNPT